MVIYLDANATQPLRPAARDAMYRAWEIAGNPYSVHAAGRAARRVMEDARETIAACHGTAARNLVFTSGGTEADALAIHALGTGRRLLISAVEHDAVRAARPDAITLPVDPGGRLDIAALEARLADNIPSLVCLMLANNETGVIQPVADAAAICRCRHALLHVDAVQAAGRIPVRLPELGAHSLAISSHKLGGPAGIGALLLAEDAPFASALIAGGGQERGRRGGTPSVALAAGFAAAATEAGADDPGRVAALRDAAEAAVVNAGAIVCGDRDHRLPNTTCLALPGVAASTQVMALDLDGIAVSAGAACSSGKVQASHVLKAMGLDTLAGSAIRVSLPWNVTEADIEGFVHTYARLANRLCPQTAGHRVGLVTTEA
ncbi:MAG TPA: aminotransferase class V-fold PLP-dependent enzyme [Rhodopila sp.]|nr:aminotransferase class V-fold PLP-dependent enzyme [Rhodopila sp.]